jgi:hypothetical protein
MTAQVSDTITLDGLEYSIAAIQNRWPFDPRQEGFAPKAPHSGCWRGFVARYAVDRGLLVLDRLEICLGDAQPPAWYGVEARKSEHFEHSRMWEYADMSLPMLYTGGVIACDGFLDEFYVHLGFHRPHCYAMVKELIFEDGALAAQHDRSARMETKREAVRAQKLAELESDEPPPERSYEEMNEFVARAYSLSYAEKWPEDS